jgi:hypothetical protein
MTLTSLVRTTSAVALAAILIACGSEETDRTVEDGDTSAQSTLAGTPSESPDATAEAKGGCSYITEQEATEALGQPSKYRSNDGSANCIIDPVTEGPKGVSVDFTVEPDSPGSWELYKDGSAVANIGEKAMWKDGMGLIALKGGNIVKLMISGSGKIASPELQPKAEAFATKVLGHM